MHVIETEDVLEVNSCYVEGIDFRTVTVYKRRNIILSKNSIQNEAPR